MRQAQAEDQRRGQHGDADHRQQGAERKTGALAVAEACRCTDGALVALVGHVHGAADRQRKADRWPATQRHAEGADHEGDHRADAAVGQCGDAVEQVRGEVQLRQRGRGFMPQLGQAQGGDQRQQAPVGDGAGVVGGACLAAEGKGHGLGARRAGQVVDGVPGRGEGAPQHQREHEAHGQVGVDPRRGELDRPGADPVGDQRGGFGAHAQQQRIEPAGDALGAAGQFGHVAEGRDVGALPGAPAEQARQQVGRAQQQQRDARQPAYGILGNDRGGRLVQGRGGRGEGVIGKKKGSAVNRAALDARARA
ncbi:hypothetical protein FQZ97_705210 [compost metagenome]